MSERKEEDIDDDDEQEDDETYTDEEDETDEHKDEEEDEITNEENASLASEEQYNESEEEESVEGEEKYLSDIEEFEDGMTLEDREKIKEARALYFEEEAKKLKPQIQEDMRNDIDEEWRGIMTLPELKSTTFDFQILRNLLEAETTQHKGNSSDKNVPHFVNTDQKTNFEKKRVEKLQAKQKHDNWRYDIGLIMEHKENKKIDTEGNNIPGELTEEDHNEEEEEIESIE
jgi:hypothetical protein